MIREKKIDPKTGLEVIEVTSNHPLARLWDRQQKVAEAIQKGDFDDKCLPKFINPFV